MIVWAAARRRLVLGGALAVAILSAFALTRLTFDHDVLHLLPQRGPAVQAFARYLSLFGSLDRLYVVIESADERPIAEHADSIAAFAERLRASPDIAHVDSGFFGGGHDWSYLADRQLLLFDAGRLPHVIERLSPGGMEAALARSRELLTLPSEPLKALVRQDPVGLLPLLREQMSGGRALPVDPTAEGYVSADGRRRLLIVEPTEPPYDTAYARRVLRQIEEARQVLTVPPSDDWGEDDEPRVTAPPRVEVAGGHRVAIETEKLVRRETIRNTAESLVAVLAILLIALRSPLLVLYGGVPIALASIAVLGLAAALAIPLSPAASGSAAMLFGLGVDASVLLFFRYREETFAGRGGRHRLEGLSGSARSIVLGVVTTAATFAALLWMDFPSLQEIGALVGGGILLCGAFTLLAIPALMAAKEPRFSRAGSTVDGLARFVGRNPKAILGVAAAITLVLGAAAPGLHLVASLERLRPRIAATEVEGRIAAQFGLPEHVYLIVAEGDSLEPLLEAHQRLVDRLGTAADAPPLDSPVAMLPPLAEQAARAARVSAAGLPDADALVQRVNDIASRVGFVDGTFAAFAARLPRLLDPRARITLAGLHEHGLTDIVGRSIVQTESGFAAVAYAYPRTDEQARVLAGAVDQAGGGLQLTGTPLVDRELATRFWPQFVSAVAAGSIAVLLIVAIGFKRAGDTVLALLPVGLGLLWMAGILALAGVTMDLFSAFGVLTFIGVGVDYGIHLVHRHRESGRSDPLGTLAQIGPALLLAAATTAAGFLTLCFSEYPPLRSLGLVLVTSVASAIAITVLVIPALLVVRGRR
jgi:predicted RND superfamily exporter protein